VSYPVIAGGRVFVSVASGMEGYKTGQTIIALDVNTGRTIWSHHVVEDSTGFLGLSYDAGSVFAMSSGGQMIAYAAATGAQEWQRSLPFRQPSDSPPLAWGGQLYVQTNGWLFALHERTGKIAWYQQVNGGDAGSPALAGERVLAGYPCQAYAFAAHDGAQLWHDDKGCSGGGGVTAAAYGDRVYTNDGGRSWVRDAATGGVLGRTTSQQIPALDGDTGYFMKGPKLVAISLARMKPRWEFKGDGTLVGVPLVVSDTVYIGSSKGHLVALNADGRLANTIDLGAPVYWPHGPSSTTPTGMNAGDGVLAVAASDRLVVFR
jgi:outer membrane protein assembly factor BamB